MYSSWTCWVFWGFFPPSGSVSLQPSFFVFLNLFILLFNFIYLFILAVLGLCCCARAFLQLQRAGATLHCGAWASHCGGFSCCRAHRLQQLWHVGSVIVARRLQSTGSVVVAHGLSCSTACGIFPDQGLNPCPLHWQANS